MENDERLGNYYQWTDARVNRANDKVWTSLPAYVKPGSYNPTKATVTLVSSVKGVQKVFDDQGNYTYEPVTLPEMQDVPVHFPSWGGYSITGPIGDNDGGMVMFSSRNIDGWFQNGTSGTSQAQQLEFKNQLGDCYFIPGLKSQPQKLNPAPATTGVELRSDDGTCKLNFSKNGMTLTFPGGSFNFDTSGNFWATGEITRGHGTGDSVTVGQHTHGQGNDSHGDSEVETNKPTANT
jgi:hypothetical protein